MSEYTGDVLLCSADHIHHCFDFQLFQYASTSDLGSFCGWRNSQVCGNYRLADRGSFLACLYVNVTGKRSLFTFDVCTVSATTFCHCHSYSTPASGISFALSVLNVSLWFLSFCPWSFYLNCTISSGARSLFFVHLPVFCVACFWG